MKTQTTLAFASLLLVVACATPIEKARRVTMKNSDPPKECERVGVVIASVLEEKDTDDDLKDRLEERAIAKGGNYIRLDSISEKRALTGTAYHCP